MKKGVHIIYSEVAPHYERINHILTLGLDRIWRRRTGRAIRGRGGRYWLDLCSGTGELAEQLVKAAPTGTVVVAVDGSLPMLSRARIKPSLHDALISLAEVDRLPFPDGTFDLAAISFATRNLNPGPDVLLGYLREFHRVLRPGGLFVNLETSQPKPGWIRWMFHRYIRLAVRPLGRWLSGSDAGYGYLAHTIPRFYPAAELSGLLHRAGFDEVKVKSYFLGIAAAHFAEKSGG